MEPQLQQHQQAPEDDETMMQSSSAKKRIRTFEENYQELLVYKATHGDLMVPNRYKNDRVLGKWVSHLREYYQAGQISPERIEALEAIGFVWAPHEKRWNENFEKLKIFHQTFGHCKVPTYYKEDKTLGKWVARQREDSNTGIMPEERKKKLDALGFSWNIKKKHRENRNTSHHDEKWQKHYDKLCAYVKEYGDANVPDEWEPDRSLSKWIKGQRTIFNRSLMPKERLKKLEEIGFVFSYDSQKKQQNWNRMYDLLKLCRTEDGRFLTAKAGDDQGSLARWMVRQREKYKYHKLEPGREVLLTKLNFRFPDRAPKEEIAANDNGGDGDGDDDGDEDGDNDYGGANDQLVEAALNDNSNGAVARLETAAHHTNGLVNVGDTERASGETAGGLANNTTGAGKKVAESIGVLAKFLSISAEEVSARLSHPATTTVGSGKSNEKGAGSTGLNVFGTLMPLIVKLRSVVDVVTMVDCGDFMERMIQGAKQGLSREPPRKCTDSDPYNRLLSLAVELGNVLDHSERSKAVVQNCESYFEHMMEKMEMRKRKRVEET